MVNLEAKAKQLRKTVLEMCIKAGTGHVTSCFSCVEIMVALFYRIMKPNDIFILSKGQASPLLYAILADKRLINEAELWKFATKEGALSVHLDHHIKGAIITAGSLGHGLGIACGMALADRTRNIYCLLGDGECYEGSIWEAAMFAGNHYLDNLIAIIDFNKLMATDWVQMQPFCEKWRAFRWHAFEVNGYHLPEWITQDGRPKVLIARTIKGKGIPFMENVILWHGVAPKGEDAERARMELERGYTNNP